MPQVTIRAESCKSCGYCVKFCPKGILAVGTEVNSKGYPYVTAAHPKRIGARSALACAPTRPSKSTSKEERTWQENS